MTRELLIESGTDLVRVARLEDGVVEALFVERVGRQGTAGNIYRGRVSRVLPGMQAAFVDIGTERAGFLHMSDLQESQVLSAGQEILVQVLKDALGGKGPRLSTRIGLPSRRLVLVPGGSGVKVSEKIPEEEEKTRLGGILESLMSGTGYGYIVRTAADGAGADELHAEMVYLRRVWESVLDSPTDGPRLLHSEIPLTLRAVRDLAGLSLNRIITNCREVLEEARRFTGRFLPECLDKLELHDGERPLFESFGVEEVIRGALSRRVPFGSGGYLVIDQTEALVVIDVNTGGFVGKRDLEDTAFRTNIEAASAIARQLRLRNLGGIIIIDFIDMDDPGHRQLVLERLEAEVARDSERTRIGAISPLGLVEMTRRRTRESLEQALCEVCPACDGRGTVEVS